MTVADRRQSREINIQVSGHRSGFAAGIERSRERQYSLFYQSQLITLGLQLQHLNALIPIVGCYESL